MNPIAGLPAKTAAFFMVLFLFTFLTYSLLWSDAPYLDPDSKDYLAIAKDFSDFHLDKPLPRPMGYALLLALTGSTEKGTRFLFITQLLLYCVSVWIIVCLLSLLGFSAWQLKLFGILAVLPPFLEPAGQILTENLAQFLLVSSFGAALFWIHQRKIRFLLASGVLMGFCAVVRPTFILASAAVGFSLVFLSWFLKNQFIQFKDSIKAGSIIIVVSSVVIVCFAAYNFVRNGTFTITGDKMSLALSLSTKTAKVLERLPDTYAKEREVMIVARDRSLVARDGSHEGSQYCFIARPELERVSGKQGADFERLLLNMNLILIKRAPLNYLLNVFQAIPAFWFPSTPRLAMAKPLVRIFWMLFHFVWIAFFMIQLVVLQGVSIIALIRRFRNSTQDVVVHPNELSAYVIAAILIFYLMTVSCALNIGLGRYRMPADPLIMFLCFIGGRSCWRLVRN